MRTIDAALRDAWKRPWWLAPLVTAAVVVTLLVLFRSPPSVLPLPIFACGVWGSRRMRISARQRMTPEELAQATMADTEMETLDRMRWKATVIVAGLVAIPLIFTLVLVAIANGSD